MTYVVFQPDMWVIKYTFFSHNLNILTCKMTTRGEMLVTMALENSEIAKNTTDKM